MTIYTVALSKKAKRDLKALPKHITAKLLGWVYYVAEHGLQEARKIPGYHDEPLVGKRKGQRSIRLSRAYRAIYHIDQSGKIECVEVIEVNKHDY